MHRREPLDRMRHERVVDPVRAAEMSEQEPVTVRPCFVHIVRLIEGGLIGRRQERAHRGDQRVVCEIDKPTLRLRHSGRRCRRRARRPRSGSRGRVRRETKTGHPTGSCRGLAQLRCDCSRCGGSDASFGFADPPPPRKCGCRRGRPTSSPRRRPSAGTPRRARAPSSRREARRAVPSDSTSRGRRHPRRSRSRSRRAAGRAHAFVRARSGRRGCEPRTAHHRLANTPGGGRREKTPPGPWNRAAFGSFRDRDRRSSSPPRPRSRDDRNGSSRADLRRSTGLSARRIRALARRTRGARRSRRRAGPHPPHNRPRAPAKVG